MLKAILQIILTIILGYVVQQYLPFWAIAIAAGLVALVFKYKYSMTSFSAGFLGAFILWCAFAFTIDTENTQRLSGLLGEMFTIEGSYLIYATGIIGGLLGGFGALTGTSLRALFSS